MWHSPPNSMRCMRTYGLGPRHVSHTMGKSERSQPSSSLSSLCAMGAGLPGYSSSFADCETQDLLVLKSFCQTTVLPSCSPDLQGRLPSCSLLITHVTSVLAYQSQQKLLALSIVS